MDQQDDKFVLYVLDDCIGCKVIASNLDKLHITYETKNIRSHIDEAKSIGITDVPALVVRRDGCNKVLVIGSRSIDKLMEIVTL